MSRRRNESRGQLSEHAHPAAGRSPRRFYFISAAVVAALAFLATTACFLWQAQTDTSETAVADTAPRGDELSESTDESWPLARDPGGGGQSLDTVTTADVLTRRRSERDILDPRLDGWDTELIADHARARLERLVGLLRHTDRIQAAELAPGLTPQFRCSQLRPAQLSRCVSRCLHHRAAGSASICRRRARQFLSR